MTKPTSAAFYAAMFKSEGFGEAFNQLIQDGDVVSYISEDDERIVVFNDNSVLTVNAYGMYEDEALKDRKLREIASSGLSS